MEIYDGKKFIPIKPEQFLAQLERLESFSSLPFNDTALAILGALSKRLLQAPLAKQAPQLTALGFWLRPSQLKAMKQNFEASLQSQSIGTSRGIAFHLPPQNVDTLFVYSWALSLLAGNVNIVRAPSELPDILSWLLETIHETLTQFDRTTTQIFCRYSFASTLNAEISKISDLRMIWGGDTKVNMVSANPVRPDGLSIGFPDRKSFSVLSATSYAMLDEALRDDLANRLYNDMYWFDQMGCGSPRVIFWIGGARQHSRDLYERLDKVALSKNYDVETGIALSKFSYMNELLASELGSSGVRFSNRLSVLKAEFHEHLLEKTQGGGMLLEVDISDIKCIRKFLGRPIQTITHFGLALDEIEHLGKEMALGGGFRLVPIGEALSFEETWDGISLIRHMTRQVTIRV